MATNIFVNLPVADLPRSVDFFKKLGYDFHEQFTDESAASMLIGEHMYAMLLTPDKFNQFTSKPISDAHHQTEVLVALSVDSRQAVDELVSTAVCNGAVEARRAEDHGWMYGRAYHDLDGHIWEILWMDKNYLNGSIP
jgi:predicted lactoylglutathione lyase